MNIGSNKMSTSMMIALGDIHRTGKEVLQDRPAIDFMQLGSTISLTWNKGLVYLVVYLNPRKRKAPEISIGVVKRLRGEETVGLYKSKMVTIKHGFYSSLEDAVAVYKAGKLPEGFVADELNDEVDDKLEELEDVND